MMIVMWAYKKNLFALPLETHTKNDSRNVPEAMLHEYICVRGYNDSCFVHQALHYDPLEGQETC